MRLEQTLRDPNNDGIEYLYEERQTLQRRLQSHGTYRFIYVEHWRQVTNCNRRHDKYKTRNSKNAPLTQMVTWLWFDYLH